MNRSGYVQNLRDLSKGRNLVENVEKTKMNNPTTARTPESKRPTLASTSSVSIDSSIAKVIQRIEPMKTKMEPHIKLMTPADVVPKMDLNTRPKGR